MNLNRGEIDRGKEKILNACMWRTAQEMEDLGGHLARPYTDLLLAWERDARIMSLLHEGRRLYPTFQFDTNLEPIPIVAQILERIGMDKDGWGVCAWFTFPNSWVSDRDNAYRPMDILDRENDLLLAASHYRNSYIA